MLDNLAHFLSSKAGPVSWPAIIAVGLTTVLLAVLLFELALRWHVRHIPSPPGIPLIGHVHYLLSKPWLGFSRFAKELGPVYSLRVWNKAFVVVASADLTKQILKDAKHKYIKDDWSYDYFRDILGHGLVTSEGAVWKAHRRLLSPAFHFAALERLHAVFDAAAGRLVSTLAVACRSQPATGVTPDDAGQERVIDALLASDVKAGRTSRSDTTTIPLGRCRAVAEISSLMRATTLQVIAQIALGFRPEQASVFPELFEAVLDELNDRPYQPWRALLPWVEGPHRRRLRELDGLVGALIAARRQERLQRLASQPRLAAQPAAGSALTNDAASSGAASLDDAAAGEDGADGTGAGGVGSNTGVSVNGKQIFADGAGDMLDMILDSGVELTDKQIADEVKTQLFAGHETSSMMLTWACYLLARHPRVYARAVAEVQANLGLWGEGEGGKGGAAAPPPAMEQYRQLTYLDWVLRESMRLYTPVPILNRQCVEADTVGGYAVPPGAVVILSAWALHNDPALWGPDAAEFRPERFAPEEARARHPWAYMPFSLGERNCIGQNLAMTEAKVVLGALLRRFHLALPAAQPEPELDSYVIPVRPHRRLYVVLEERGAASAHSDT